ncbi:MAG: HK97 family phage prohead protease [Gammaproteobacteria bacterium]|nr:HK97 family phage prohead protease [Gammaproteobacteria bacterium]
MERLLTGAIEFRGGRSLAGIALPWETRSDAHKERFERGSIELAASGVSFKLGHSRVPGNDKVISWTGGGGLTVESREDGLYLESDLAEANPIARRAREQAERGVTGLSVEFRAIRDRFDDNGDRVVQAAILGGVALVRNPSYPTAAEFRAGAWARSQIMPAGVRACNCLAGTECDSVDFAATAFTGIVADVEKGDRDLVAHTGGFSPDKVLASASAGTLAVSIGDEGELIAEIDEMAAETPAGRMLAESNAATAPVLRPLIDDDRSEYRDEGNVRIYTSAWISSLLLKVAQDPEGWEGIEIAGGPPVTRRDDHRRRALRCL